MILLWSICVITYGASIYRLRGSGKIPRPIMQVLFSVPYAYVCVNVGWWYAAVVLVISTTILCKGWGQYFLTIAKKYIKPEWIDWILVPIFEEDPRTWASAGNPEEFYEYEVEQYGHKKLYWRCFTGMSITGLLFTLPAGIVTMNPFIALSGLLKGPCYAVGCYIMKEDKAIELSEYITGGVLFLSLYLSYVLYK